VGIAGNPEVGFEIYPNPVSDKVMIRMNVSGGSKCMLKLVDVPGQVISEEKFDGLLTGQVISVDVSKLAEGVYFLRIDCNGSSSVQRIIKD